MMRRFALLLSTAAVTLLPVTDPLWDTSWLLSDRSVAGSFLSGLVGYRAQPSAFEAGAYLLYLIAAGFLLFGPGQPRPSQDSQEDRIPPKVG